MTFQQILYALATVLTLSAGQVLFKLAAEKLNFTENSLLENTLYNPPLLIALFIYGLATFAWLLLIRDVPLRIAYPFAALAFVMVPLLAHFFLGETLSIKTFLGASLIIAGVFISST